MTIVTPLMKNGPTAMPYHFEMQAAARQWGSSYRWTYPASTGSIAAARNAIGAQLRIDGFAHVADDVRLLVSELVTNAILHAHSSVEVALFVGEHRLRVEVTDHCRNHPEPRRPTTTDSNGRGLLIVDALAEAWGVEGRDDGKTVWFELAASHLAA